MATTRTIHTIPLVGGHLALDFTNTCDGRDTDTPMEYLNDYSDALAWAERLEHFPKEDLVQASSRARSHAAEAEEVFDDLIGLRACLYDVLCYRIAEHPPPRRLLDTLNRHFSDALSTGLVAARSDDAARLHFSGDLLKRLPRFIVFHGVALLTSPTMARVKRCDRGGCGWLFLDQSRRQNRRWCSMQECGNAMKQARYRKAHAPMN